MKTFQPATSSTLIGPVGAFLAAAPSCKAPSPAALPAPAPPCELPPEEPVAAVGADALLLALLAWLAPGGEWGSVEASGQTLLKSQSFRFKSPR